ncbi:hypothetical protein D3C78_866320 [compost metagenome]
MRSGAPRIAHELDMIDCRLVPIASVDDQPVLDIGLTDEVLTDQGSDPGAGAIRAHQVAGANVVGMTLLVAYRGDDTIRFLGQVLELEATQAGYRLEPGDLLAHRVLEVGLVEGHQLGMAVDASCGIGSCELPEHRGEHAHFRNRDLLESVLGQTGKLQDTQRLVVQGNGAGH